MVRLLFWLALACVLCKLAAGRWPWQLAGWDLGHWELPWSSARSAAEVRARALLGVKRNAPRNEIIEAHKRLVIVVHPDRGGTNDQVHEANAARDLLLARIADNTE